MIRLLKWLGTLLILLAVLGIGIDRYVAWSVSSQIHDRIRDLPRVRVALLLGTNKYLQRGKINWYYRYRIEAARRLYRSGKASRILISGDGRSRYYDEVKRMRRDLLKAGLPAKDLILDPGGVRTIESIRRAQGKFGVDQTIIVSQKFHLERALFLANALGMEAVGYAAKGPENTPAAWRMRLREIAARSRMVLDLILFRLFGVTST